MIKSKIAQPKRRVRWKGLHLVTWHWRHAVDDKPSDHQLDTGQQTEIIEGVFKWFTEQNMGRHYCIVDNIYKW